MKDSQFEETREDAYLDAEMRDVAISKRPPTPLPQKEGLLVFQAGITMDGVTLAIEPLSRAWLDKHFPRRTRGVTQIYLGAPPRQVMEMLQEIPLHARESLLRTLIGIPQGMIRPYEVQTPGAGSILWKGAL